MLYLFLFILGSIVGSFLNVCIYRLPREERIGMSRSHCPHCKEIIRWYDNIPFISYILLKAKCRHCGKPISFRYFIVELLTAVMLCLVWWGFRDPVSAVIYFIFVSLLIAGSFIDLDFLIIPDSITLSGIVIGLAAGFFYLGFKRSLLGALAGGGSLYLIAVTATAVLKREAMGMGDVKLLAMIGAFIGWQGALFTIFTSSLLGTIAGVILILLRKADIKGKIPFGPYLAMGSVVSLFWWRDIMAWYGRFLCLGT